MVVVNRVAKKYQNSTNSISANEYSTGMIPLSLISCITSVKIDLFSASNMLIRALGSTLLAIAARN